MTYWAEVMQDDVYMIAQDGSTAARQIRELVKNSKGTFTEEPELTIGRKKLKAELSGITYYCRREPALGRLWCD